jgi:hypothetical protein
MTDDLTCSRCGRSGSARWMVTHGHHRWSSWLLSWLGDFSGLMSPRQQLAGKRLWEDREGKHRRRAGLRLACPASLSYDFVLRGRDGGPQVVTE